MRGTTAFFKLLVFSIWIVVALKKSDCKAQNLIYLDSSDYTIRITHNNLLQLEDTGGVLPFDNIRMRSFEPLQEPVHFRNPNSAYWLKLDLENKLSNSGIWVLEGINVRIDSSMVFVCDALNCQSDTLGAAVAFGKRSFQQKNQSIVIPFEKGERKTIYLRFKNFFPVTTSLSIRNIEMFSASYTEYFLLGLFYGVIVLIAFYNILLFYSTREKAFLYYFFYVVCTGLFFLSQDGIGFQYLWPNVPLVNRYANMTALCLMTIFLLLYSSSFLNYKMYYPHLVHWVRYYIVFRLVLLLITMIWYSHIRYLYIDFLPFLLVYITSFSAYRHGVKTSIFFITGFSILLLVFAVHGIRVSGLIEASPFMLYSTNVGVLLEMTVLGIGLAVKIAELKDHEKMSQKLEQIVQERTDELDNYLYKTSHDINGPLKTIIGLADLGMLDKEYSEKYFQLIHQTSRKLDNVVHSIAEVLLLNKALLFFEEIKIGILTDELRAHAYLHNEVNTLTASVKGEGGFISDHQMLWLATKNLIDFSLRREAYNLKRKLHFSFEIAEDAITIIYKDDSKLIPHHEANSAFDIFKKIETDHTTGLELYSTRTAIRKLNGSIALKNENGKNIFEIYIPNGVLKARRK